MGSIKAIVSEPLEGHEEYHMMVSCIRCTSYRYVLVSAKLLPELQIVEEEDGPMDPSTRKMMGCFSNPWVRPS